MQPQLIRIRKVLADISMNYINKNDVSDVYHKNKVISSCKSKNDLRDEISVVQHMSAACRAAWSHELKDLPSSWLLRQVRVDWIRSQISFESISIIFDYNHFLLVIPVCCGSATFASLDLITLISQSISLTAKISPHVCWSQFSFFLRSTILMSLDVVRVDLII